MFLNLVADFLAARNGLLSLHAAGKTLKRNLIISLHYQCIYPKSLTCATNRNLDKMIADREFRSDLYYQLNVFPIRIPPLRERREDIPVLARYFAQKFAQQMEKQIETIPSATMKALMEWEWPGNVRELGNFIERAVILTRGGSLDGAAARLGINRTTLLSRMKKFGLNAKHFPDLRPS